MNIGTGSAQESTVQKNRRSPAAVLLGLILVLSIVAVDPAVGGAAAIEDAEDLALAPDLIWDVDTRSGSARHTGTYLTLVWDLQEIDGVMYVGGDFTEVVGPDGSRRPHSFLAAFDVETGAWIPTFTPDLDNVVYALDVTDDGQLVVGGEFEGGVALLDPATGAPVPGFDSTLDHSWGNAAVFTVEPMGTSLFVGGRFIRGDNARGNTVALQNLAKLDLGTGDVDAEWTPSVQAILFGGRLNQRVYDIEVDASRNRVYVGGLFASINDDPTSGSFAILDADSGDSIVGRPAIDNPVVFLYDIELDGDLVRYGGKENFTITVDADTFTRQADVVYTNNGDHQVITGGENTLWIGCHCWRAAFSGEPGQNPFRPPADAPDVNAIIAVDRATGQVRPITFDMRGSAGAWDIVEDSTGRLWVGGQFTRGGDRRVTGIARFSVRPDLDSIVTSCSVERDGVSATVSWEGIGADRYVIRRSVDNGPTFWRGRTDGAARSLTDSDRAGALQYSVEGRVGSEVAGPVLCAEIEVAPPPPTGLRSTRITRERVVLNWLAVGEVEIARDGVVIARDSDGWYTDLTVESGSTYEYRVRYPGADVWSDPISVTVL